MNVTHARTLWKKMLPYAVVALGLGIGGTAVARHLAAEDCCKPGAACCYPGSPCCAHASEAHGAKP